MESTSQQSKRPSHARAALLFAAAISSVAPFAADRADAVILYRSDQRNLTAPTGAFANSGWQLQGEVGGFLGTPIGPHWYITAKHIGATAATPLVFQGQSYFPDPTFNGGQGSIDVPGTDLEIFKTTVAFPTYAQLYDESVDGPLTGKTLIDFGRGVQRGAPIYGEVTTDAGSGDAGKPGELKGWGWGAHDGLWSWGTNVVTGVFNGGPTVGMYFTFDFNRNGLFDESMLAANDSGGAAFVQGAGGVWKLAGINFAADGTYRLAAPVAGIDTDGFFGALFDEGGLYESIGNGNFAFEPESAIDAPGTNYLSSISHNLAFIRGVIGTPPTLQTPEPTGAAAAAIVAALAALCSRRRRRRAR